MGALPKSRPGPLPLSEMMFITNGLLAHRAVLVRLEATKEA